MTVMDAVIAFVSARLDEDEAVARAVQDSSEPWPGQWEAADENYALRTHNGWVLATAGTPGGEFRPGVLAHLARHDPASALRDTAAKRKIVRRCAARMNEMDRYPNGLVSPRALLARQVLTDLAAAWDDHPDYDPGWVS